MIETIKDLLEAGNVIKCSKCGLDLHNCPKKSEGDCLCEGD